MCASVEGCTHLGTENRRSIDRPRGPPSSFCFYPCRRLFDWVGTVTGPDKTPKPDQTNNNTGLVWLVRLFVKGETVGHSAELQASPRL